MKFFLSCLIIFLKAVLAFSTLPLEEYMNIKFRKDERLQRPKKHVPLRDREAETYWLKVLSATRDRLRVVEVFPNF